MRDGGLGRIPQFDEKSRDFDIRAVTPLGPRSYTWACPANLDQKQTSECVAYSWSHELIAKPKPKTLAWSPHDIYTQAQKIDEWPGEDYDGTSVLAGVKILQQMGYIGEYRWGFTSRDGITGVSRHGPGVIGITWRDDMWETDLNGYVHWSGSQAGGHAILVRGVSLTRQAVLLHNSWGADWGGTTKGPGTAWFSFTDLDKALKDDGEFCIPTVRL